MMLDFLIQATQIAVLILYIPAFITAFLILKAFRIRNIRHANYFRVLLLQVFIHSLLFVLMCFFSGFKIAFVSYSFAMIPLYALLLLRLYNLKHGWQASTSLLSHAASHEKRRPKIHPERLKRLRMLSKRKSQWH